MTNPFTDMNVNRVFHKTTPYHGTRRRAALFLHKPIKQFSCQKPIKAKINRRTPRNAHSTLTSGARKHAFAPNNLHSEKVEHDV